MPLLVGPIAIIGLVFIGVAVVTLVVVHYWRKRADNRCLAAINLESGDSRYTDQGHNLRGEQLFRGSPLGGPPGRSTRQAQCGVMRGGEQELDDLRYGAASDGGDISSHSHCYLSGGHDAAADDPGPFTTPSSGTAAESSNAGSGGTLYTPNGPARDSDWSVDSAKFIRGGTANSVHYDCDFATRSRERLPHYYASTTNRINRTASANSSRVNTPSPLRFGVTVSTVQEDEEDPHDIANAKLAVINADDETNEHGKSIGKGGSIRRSISRTLEERKRRHSASRQSLQPLEVHPWRLSYT